MVRLARWLLLIVLLGGIAYLLVPIAFYGTIPDHNTDAERFDTLIVLGHPARPDGTPDPEMRERVLESVREYRDGKAPHIIMTGASAHNRFTEAEVMAAFAQQQGVPAAAILVEPHALDTIQNIWYSRQMMQEHGWNSAEVISSSYHLPRSALILQRYARTPLAFAWRTHASEWPAEYGERQRCQYIFHEALGTVKLRLNGFGSRKYLPDLNQESNR